MKLKSMSMPYTWQFYGIYIINQACTAGTSILSVVWLGEEKCFATRQSTFVQDRS